MDRRRLERGAVDPARWVYGVQPVQQLLLSRTREVERVFVSREPRGGVGRILRSARLAGIPVTHLSREQLAARVGARASHQGIAAQVSPVPYADVEELCRAAEAHRDGLLVLVDRVTDPGNLGAIVRTCAAAGAHGVILARDGTAGLTAQAMKASAGAVERIPVAREATPPKRIRELQARGFRAVVLDPRGSTPWDRVDLCGRTLIVAGGEEVGARPGVVRACNIKVAIPLERGIDSLNVSVAAAVLLFEAQRQRRRASRRP